MGISVLRWVAARISWALLLAAVAALAVASGAQAETVTLGSPLSATFTPEPCSTPCTLANGALSEPGALVASPVDGVVIRWRMVGGALAFAYKLRVLRPQGGGNFAGAGTSAPETPSGAGTQTFSTSLPIKTGDLIGIDVEGGAATIGVRNDPMANFLQWKPLLAEASSSAPISQGPAEIGFNADVQPPPGIESILPNVGSISGGLRVGISGHDLTGATAVKFGAIPASTFTVESDNNVTAVAPPSKTPGDVDISVTTAAGTTPAVTADKFTYVACVVPKLKGKRLKAAKKTLRKADCKLGKVKHKRGKKARKGKKAKVIGQSAKPGKVFPPGKKVNVKVG
jgi:hypothetical protein